MSPPDDDLDLQPMHTSRAKPLLIALGVVAVVAGVVVVNRRLDATRRDKGLARAADAWNELAHCVVGDDLGPRELPSIRARRIEVATWESSRLYEDVPRARRWPYRCASHASVLTHALFESGSDAPEHRLLSMLTSRAASALEEGELHTGEHDHARYLDELFEAERRAELPAGAPPRGPAPPRPASPLSPRAFVPLFLGRDAHAPLATDTVPAPALRVLAAGDPTTLCTFSESLATARCASATANAVAATLPPAATALPLPVAQSAIALGPVAVADQLVFVAAPPSATATATTTTPDAGAASDAGDAAAPLARATLYTATLLPAGPPRSPALPLGAVPGGAGGSLAFCASERGPALAVRGAGDRAAVSFLREGRWSAPVETTARAGAFTCRGDEATFTWIETSPNRLLRQARCTASGCTDAHGPLPQYEPEPTVTDLDGRVLLVASPERGHGLRFRLGPIERLYEQDDVVVLDDGEHGGVAVESIDGAYPRGRAAVVLFTAHDGERPTYALRIDAGGAYAPVETR